MPLLNLMTSNNPKMDWCNTLYRNYGYNVTFNFDYTLCWFNDYSAAHKKTNKSRSDGFLHDVYQIWKQIIWLTPEKGHLMSSALICWEQIEPSPKVRTTIMTGNNWGFCLKKYTCNHSCVFQSQFRSWPGTDWDWIPQSRWFAPNGTCWIYGSYL